jgi:hypothetical protein
LSEQHPLCQIVDEYECAWWKGRKPRSLDSVVTLDHSSFENCIEKHIIQIPEHIEPTSDISAMPSFPSHADITATVSHTKQSQCQKCDKYSQILSTSLQDILDIHRFANKMVTCSETQRNLDMRRASTFNLLHEAALIKELNQIPETPDSSSSSSKSRNIVESWAETARKNLERLRPLPENSYKWTWGEDLTKDEVLALRRSGTKPMDKMHSGYDLSLKQGVENGVHSAIPSMPKSVDEQKNVPPHPTLPDYVAPDLPYFKKRQNLLYDPLGKARRAMAPALPMSPTPAKLTMKNVNNHSMLSLYELNDQSSGGVHFGDIGSISGSGKEDIAYVWESLSVEKCDSRAADENGETPAADENEKTPVPDIANVWQSLSDERGETPAIDEHVETPATDIAYVWQSLSDENAESSEAEDGPQPVTGLESNYSTKAPVASIEDEWMYASDEDDTEGDNQSSTEKASGIENEWPSASQDEDDGKNDRVSSQLPANITQLPAIAQFEESPSRITINNNSPIRLSDAWPSPDLDHSGNPSQNSSLESPNPITLEPGSYRTFGPEDFSDLKDFMFEEKLSDSDSDEEYDDYDDDDE